MNKTYNFKNNTLQIVSKILATAVMCLFFVSCIGTYEKRDGKIIYSYLPNAAGRIERELIDVDLETFKKINHVYAKDKNQAYYRGLIIVGANIKTFKILDDTYSTDGRGIFYENRRFSTSAADNFHILEDGYSLDSDSVYYNGRTLKEANPSSFQMVGSHMAKDNNNVYSQGRRYDEIVDPASFQLLKERWAKDNVNYYNEGKKVEGVDSGSFEILNSCYAKDKNHVYYSVISYGARTIEGADPASFKIGEYLSWGSDKNHKYSYGEIVEN